MDDASTPADADYLQGLKDAVRAGLALAIAIAEGEEVRPDSIPQELIAQARLAARSGVSLDAVLRRYLAGHTLLCDYLLQEVGGGHALQRALRALAVLLDQIVVAVTDAYRLEIELRRRTPQHRRAEQVKRLLAGEPFDAQLEYDFDRWHLGVLASGAGAPGKLREFAAAFDRRLLLVRPGDGSVWGWFGGSRKLATPEAARLAAVRRRAGVSLAFGEPGHGVDGWRLTHRQAKAAMPIALRDTTGVVCYGDVALLAAAQRDDLLAESLYQAYLVPLEHERDGGKALRQTLRAYLEAGRNISSAAAALGISRETVKKRVRIAEEKIGQPLGTRAAEIETALRL